MRKDTDELNLLTLKQHSFYKDQEMKQKLRDGRFANSYAPEGMRIGATGGQQINHSMNQSANVI